MFTITIVGKGRGPDVNGMASVVGMVDARPGVEVTQYSFIVEDEEVGNLDDVKKASSKLKLLRDQINEALAEGNDEATS